MHKEDETVFALGIGLIEKGIDENGDARGTVRIVFRYTITPSIQACITKDSTERAVTFECLTMVKGISETAVKVSRYTGHASLLSWKFYTLNTFITSSPK